MWLSSSLWLHVASLEEAAGSGKQAVGDRLALMNLRRLHHN
jgi:hypothetical protein